VLLWWKKIRYRVHLADRLLIACEIHCRGRSRRIVRKTQLPFDPGERSVALQRLRDWMAPAAPSAQLEWVLGLSEVKYVLLPWSRNLTIPSLRDAFAGALFEQQFGADSSAFAACFTTGGHGQAQLVSFVSHELLAELAAHARAAGVHLAGIEPGIASVLSRFDGVLKNECGALRVIDGNRQAIVSHDHGRVTDLVLRPFCAGSADARYLERPGDEVRRIFSSGPAASVREPAGTLMLANGSGFAASEDAAYAFALCGVL
jgi:hypothetical protein